MKVTIKVTVLINAQNASWPRTISTITDKLLTPLATHDVTPCIKVILTMAVSTSGKAITTHFQLIRAQRKYIRLKAIRTL